MNTPPKPSACPCPTCGVDLYAIPDSELVMHHNCSPPEPAPLHSGTPLPTFQELAKASEPAPPLASHIAGCSFPGGCAVGCPVETAPPQDLSDFADLIAGTHPYQQPERPSECFICGGCGEIEVGTGYGNSEGGELTEVIECPGCAQDRRDFEKQEFQSTLHEKPTESADDYAAAIEVRDERQMLERLERELAETVKRAAETYAHYESELKRLTAENAELKAHCEKLERDLCWPSATRYRVEAENERLTAELAEARRELNELKQK